MKKRRDNMRMARLGILAAAVILGGSWQVSAAQADAREETSLKQAESAVSENGFEIDEDGVLTRYTGTGGDVTIPESVISIGYMAFYECVNLERVTIPGSVNSIEIGAFFGCSNLTSVTIAAGLESIGEGAFASCYNLERITIPDSVTDIGESIFSSSVVIVCGKDTAAEAYAKANGNPLAWEDYTYRLLEDPASNLTAEIAGYTGKETEISIPLELNGRKVTGIGESAFYGCAALKSVTIPNDVTSIGASAFEHCTSLASVTIPNGVTSIGASAFEYCTSLASVTIPDGVTSIGADAFLFCYNLARIEIPASVTEIGETAFDSQIVIACGKDTPAEAYARANGNPLAGGAYTYRLLEDPASNLTAEIAGYTGKETEISIPLELNGRKVTGIGESAFHGCAALKSVTIPDGVTSIGASAFEGCASLASVEIPNGVTSIGASAFEGCASLASVEIPNGVTVIESSVFEDCAALKSVAIPNGVTSIGAFAFDGCSSLASVTIPDGVTSIGADAFLFCDNLARIEIPASVTEIGESAFSSSVVIACGKDTPAEAYARANGNPLAGGDYTYRLLEDPASNLTVQIIGYVGKETNVTIPAQLNGRNVTVIGESAFSKNGSLASVVIPDGVTSIWGNAFFDCDSLASITIPKSVTEIEVGAFLECEKLVIDCEKGSLAESYANLYGIRFRYIGSGEIHTPGITENDQTQGNTGNDQAQGNAGNDQAQGNAGNNQAQGNTGNDQAQGNTGNDQAQGNTGNNQTQGNNQSSEKPGITEKPENTKKPKKRTITAKNITKTYGARAFSLGAKASGGGKLTYSVSDRKVATISKTGKVSIKGCGVTKITIKAAADKNYSAAKKTVTLTVKPKQQTVASLKSQKSKALTVKWKKDAKATGYILQYSTDKKFKKSVKSVTVKKNTATSKTVSKLKGGRKYYVRICSYKTSGGKQIKGAYSKVKAVTVRR